MLTENLKQKREGLVCHLSYSNDGIKPFINVYFNIIASVYLFLIFYFNCDFY